LLRIVYYERLNGQKPVLEWLNGLGSADASSHRNILAKLDKLEIEGFKLLNTEILKPIRGYSNMYEVTGGRYRILGYYDEIKDVFVLLHGFMKKKQSEHKQIAIGFSLADEYRSTV
jgi:phage-related protein